MFRISWDPLLEPLNVDKAWSGVGDVSLKFSKSFTLGGIALGTIVTVGVYHLARWLAPHELSDAAGGTNIILDAPGMYVDDDTPQ